MLPDAPQYGNSLPVSPRSHRRAEAPGDPGSPLVVLGETSLRVPPPAPPLAFLSVRPGPKLEMGRQKARVRQEKGRGPHLLCRPTTRPAGRGTAPLVSALFKTGRRVSRYVCPHATSPVPQKPTRTQAVLLHLCGPEGASPLTHGTGQAGGRPC